MIALQSASFLMLLTIQEHPVPPVDPQPPTAIIRFEESGTGIPKAGLEVIAHFASQFVPFFNDGIAKVIVCPAAPYFERRRKDRRRVEQTVAALRSHGVKKVETGKWGHCSLLGGFREGSINLLTAPLAARAK